MKNMILILSVLFFFTGCNEEEIKQEEQDNSIYGTWQLVSFINESINSILLESDFQNSNQITIDFKEDMSFIGSTVRNNFFGNYSLKRNDGELILMNISTTEVNEPEWGNLFYDKLKLTYNQQTENWESTYAIQNDSLRIYSSEQEYMLFYFLN